MSQKALIVGGQQFSLATMGSNAAVGPKGALLGVRKYVAAKAGIADADLKKVVDGETVGLNFKEVKALVIAKGGTAEQIKAWSKEYDESRSQFYVDSRKLSALAAADPNMRSESRIVMGKNGPIGVNTKFRFERQGAGSSKVAQLEAKVAELQAALAARPALTA